MHGLTCGSCKRNRDRGRATEMNGTRGNPADHQRLRNLRPILVTAPALDLHEWLTCKLGHMGLRCIVAALRAGQPTLTRSGNAGALASTGWIWLLLFFMVVPLPASGAAFDFLAHRVRRAPERVLEAKAEWVWRLMFEPRCLGWRYLIEMPPALLQLNRTARVG
jgi:hypothetical protein